MRPCVLFLAGSAVCMLLATGLAHAQQVTVTAVSGGTLTLSAGRSEGLREGLTGKACTDMPDGERKVEVCVARFRVTAVRERSATATVFEGEAARLAANFRALFDAPLVRPTPTAQPKPQPTPVPPPSTPAPAPSQPPAAAPAPGRAPDAALEIALWDSVKDSDDPVELQAYLDRFPDGTFAKVAQARLEKLRGSGEQPGATPEGAAPTTLAPSSRPAPRPLPEQVPSPTAAPAPAAPAVRRGELVELGPGVVPPSLISVDRSAYPPTARRLKVQGEVVVSVLVDENGKVIDTRLDKPDPQEVGFNESALAAARSATFRPATKDGVPVRVWHQIRIPFKL